MNMPSPSIPLGRKLISPVVWQRIFESTCYLTEYRRSDFFKELDALEGLRTQADYNTGSISAAACWALMAVAHYFKPKTVIEVGTFIGKSTLSLLRGMEFAGVSDPKIYTCDFSNDIKLPFVRNDEVSQFPRSSSTDMFQKLNAAGVVCDLLALDGRLQPGDFELLGSLLHQNSIILLDDFEGVEKGVLNGSSLMQSLQKTHTLVYPPSHDMLNRLGFFDDCTSALIVPRALFQLSNQ
jgi:hypothetical protein